MRQRNLQTCLCPPPSLLQVKNKKALSLAVVGRFLAHTNSTREENDMAVVVVAFHSPLQQPTKARWEGNGGREGKGQQIFPSLSVVKSKSHRWQTFGKEEREEEPLTASFRLSNKEVENGNPRPNGLFLLLFPKPPPPPCCVRTIHRIVPTVLRREDGRRKLSPAKPASSLHFWNTP